MHQAALIQPGHPAFQIVDRLGALTSLVHDVRPEMRGMERSLVLNQLDVSWKNHLYTMDHLRSTVGLRGYAQEDPKTVYKREGMKVAR